MKNKIEQPPILITGCARSGTSMVAGAINLCGAFGGSMSGKNSYNRKGMFENYKIRQNIVKPFLRSISVDPLGQYPLPKIGTLKIPTYWCSRIEDVMLEQGYTGGHWFYKCAKATSIWPVFHYAFPNAKWVVVRRKTEDIINSCTKTAFMKAFHKEHIRRAVGAKDEHDGWLWWVNQHEARWVEMIEAGLNVQMVWPERMVLGDYTQLFSIVEWLGLKWNSEVLEFVDQKLWHSRKALNGR